MLVLSRKNQESVVVGAADGLHRLFKVKVLEIRGTNVKLGFEGRSWRFGPSFGVCGNHSVPATSDQALGQCVRLLLKEN